MAIWKEQTAPKKESITMPPEPALASAAEVPSVSARNFDAPRQDAPRPELSRHDLSRQEAPRRTVGQTKESVIASDITIEGKVNGLPKLTHLSLGRRKAVRKEWLDQWMEWETFQVLRRTNASLSRRAMIDDTVAADQRGHGLGVSLEVYSISGLHLGFEALRCIDLLL